MASGENITKGDKNSTIGKWLPTVLCLCMFKIVLVTAALYYPPVQQDAYAELSPTPFVEMIDAQGRVNINTAQLEELCVLPGIGEAKALAIIEWRAENGNFASAEDLMLVYGIGEKTIEQLEALICY